MASLWSIPVSLIPIATIESNLAGFLDVIKMTRCPQKFVRWQSKVVERSFRWADTIEKMRTSIDSVQMDLAVSNMQSISVAFVDENPINAVLFPCMTLLSAILSSPLLPLCRERSSMLQTCYKESVKRIGRELTRKIFEEVSAVGYRERKLFDDIILQLQSSSSYDDSSEDDCTTSLPYEDALLATLLMEACCRDKKKNKDGLISQASIMMIESSMKSDRTILRHLCIGVTLTPCTMYCASLPLPCSTTNASSASSPSSTATSCSSFTFSPEILRYPDNSKNIQNDVITLEDFSMIIENDQLWNIIIGNIQNNVELFLLFDNDFLIFQLLLEKNVNFGEIFVLRLKVSICSALEKASDGLYSGNLGNFYPIVLFTYSINKSVCLLFSSQLFILNRRDKSNMQDFLFTI